MASKSSSRSIKHITVGAYGRSTTILTRPHQHQQMSWGHWVVRRDWPSSDPRPASSDCTGETQEIVERRSGSSSRMVPELMSRGMQLKKSEKNKASIAYSWVWNTKAIWLLACGPEPHIKFTRIAYLAHLSIAYNWAWNKTHDMRIVKQYKWVIKRSKKSSGTKVSICK